MASDFRFYPPAPEPISGTAVLDQIEMVVNELGDEINSISGGSEEALRIANQALQTANSALETAQQAAGDAQTAITNAAAAQTTANQALSDAAAAQTAAGEALSAAQAARATAEGAQTAADNAAALAQQAITTAGEASDVASQALDIANRALGIYQTTATDGLDADTYFTEPAKLYLTGTGLLNFPLDAPFFFDVYVNNDNSAAFQKVFTGDTQWMRAGVLSVDPDTGNTVVTWNSWKELASGGNEVSPDDILVATVVRSAGVDLNNVLGISRNYYATVAVGNAPFPDPTFYEIRSDSENLHTLQRATSSVTGEVRQRGSSSQPGLNAGTSSYTATFTSGTFSTSIDITVSVTGTQMRVYGMNQYLSINLAGTSIALSGILEFWAPGSDTTIDLPTNGYSLTITPGTGTNTVNVSVAGDGTETITSDTAEFTGKSTIKYLSSHVEDSANHIVFMDLATTWTDFSGSITWTTWQSVGRERLTAETNIYLRSDGNDNNTGYQDTATGALQTFTGLASRLRDIDQNGFRVIVYLQGGVNFGNINIGNGGFSGPVRLCSQSSSNMGSVGTISVAFNTPAFEVGNIIANQINVTQGGQISIGHVSDGEGTVLNGLNTSSSILYMESFGIMLSTSPSRVTFNGSCSVAIYNNGGFFAAASGSAFIYNDLVMDGRNILGGLNSSTRINYITFSGTATGQRYFANNYSTIVYNSAQTNIPGTVDGAVASGGVFV